MRIPLGLLFIVCAMFWFMPIIGIELLPVGLLLLSQDIPILRKPTARLIVFGVGLWRKLKMRFQRARSAS